MFQLERRNAIIQFLTEYESATVEDLANKLDVTPMTIRRDLQYLEDNNIVTRTFGGAVLKSRLTSETPYKDKSTVHKKEKHRIAEYAASIVQNGQTIVLDSGTTIMEVAKGLSDKKELTIVTTDIITAGYLATSTNFKILCAGGYVQNSTGACIGIKAVDFLKDIHADISFIGANSIDIEIGIATPSIDKAEVKKQMIKSSEQKILVADSSKFGKKSFAKVCDLYEFDLIITDANISNDMLEKLKENKINIRLV